MIKQDQLCKTVVLDERQVSVLLGDDVWWFAGNELGNPPAAAKVVAMCGDNMVDLSIYNQVNGKQFIEKGVCLIGDELLKNQNYRKRGSWCPRGNWSALNVT